ncbi:YbcC family protein [Bythopirellula goksoeyrii]|uniref:Probable inorganic carbon transporter subunit DabA n=1 Tax=Bythopirellula goksoeyrii TaxID=1400387 RepID=A0A5B9QPR7_9BACT|nr:DUF2309 domain-containing protein [Bythopirellula goksoeyrii]QEG36121.1 hypothetical protein Pr1d_34300 [Bythopirellula goksoeyrii]
MITETQDEVIGPISPISETSDLARLAAEACYVVAQTVAPVWPLADYVAVNPYLGLTATSFIKARKHLQSFSDCELLMPVAYYSQRFKEGQFGRADIYSAIDELVDAGVDGAELLTGRGLEQLLSEPSPVGCDAEATEPSPKPSRLQSISAAYDESACVSWTAKIHEEIGKHCAAHYDRGQAFWPSPWQAQPLYSAWRSAMRHDRRLEVMGLRGVRILAKSLPNEPAAAVARLLQASRVPSELWRAYLLCLAYELPGWSAWTQYQASWVEGGEARVGDGQGDDLIGLLAIRLSYDVALAKQFNFSMNVLGVLESQVLCAEEAAAAQQCPADRGLVRYALLRANELGYRNHVLRQLLAPSAAARHADDADGYSDSLDSKPQKLAQVAFCIDVRSERIRRHFESANKLIETIGFAGFFGIPFAYERLGESTATNQLPVLVPPQFKVVERVRAEAADQQEGVAVRRGFVRSLRKAWKRFQTASASAFAFVEATGMFFGLKLLRRVVSIRAGSLDPRCDGVAKEQRNRLGPDLAALDTQGLNLDRQADLALSILTGMGLLKDFARLVVFCGHGSQTENNPLAAGLDCGACGGHSGEPNARLAAQLLNSSEVRFRLLAKGIEISANVHFLACLHNTTTDEISFFDLDLIPSSHREDFEQLRAAAKTAANQTRLERLPLLSTNKASDPFRRALDWSEVRPEWGLTGNAAFIVAPRRLTESIDLGGRAFLHSYDHRNDPEGKVLEGILTAPMVVGSWINLQYYASTVDPRHFGSGSKTIHNVVGRFGAFSGNGGDLTTGLPWESIRDSDRYQHDPVRLLSVVAAPRAQIARILSLYSGVEQLAANGWIHLVALDGGKFYRFTPQKTWQAIDLDLALNGVQIEEPRVSEAPIPSLVY